MRLEWKGENRTERTSDWVAINLWKGIDGGPDALVSEKQTLVAQEDGDSTQPQCRLVHLKQPSSCCRMQHSVPDTRKSFQSDWSENRR